MRQSRGLTLTQVGDHVGIIPSMVSHIEMGRRDPKLSHVELFAESVDAELLVQPVGVRLSVRQREVLEAFRAELPHLSELDLEVWAAELNIRKRRRT